MIRGGNSSFARSVGSRLLALSLQAALVLMMLLVGSCGGDGESSATTEMAGTATPAPSSTSVPEPMPTPTPQPVRLDIQATRLRIPSLRLDAPIGESQTIKFVYNPPPGCPAHPEATTTLTVLNQGIVTPVDELGGLENKAWIFGHSRWLGTPGILFVLQDINLGDELVVDGLNKRTGEAITDKKYVVDSLVLTETFTGGDLLEADEPADIPGKPTVVLMTSVRERGEGRQWILDRSKLLAKVENMVPGNLEDPCHYLLLFVFATAE